MSGPKSEVWITVNTEWIPSTDVNAVFQSGDASDRFSQDVVALLTQHLYTAGLPSESRVVFGVIDANSGRVVPVTEDAGFKSIRTKDKKRKREQEQVATKVYPDDYRN